MLLCTRERISFLSHWIFTDFFFYNSCSSFCCCFVLLVGVCLGFFLLFFPSFNLSARREVESGWLKYFWYQGCSVCWRSKEPFQTSLLPLRGGSRILRNQPFHPRHGWLRHTESSWGGWISVPFWSVWAAQFSCSRVLAAASPQGMIWPLVWI